MADAPRNWIQIKRKSAALRRSVDALWKDAEALLVTETRDSISASDVLTTELSGWEELGSRILVRSRALAPAVEVEKQAQVDGFEQRLLRRLSDGGHQVHGEAGLLIIDSILHVEFDWPKLQISVNGVPSAHLEVEALISAIAGELNRLRRSITPAPRMLEYLFQAYAQVASVMNKQPGSQVDVASVMLQVAMLRQTPAFRENPQARLFREYPRGQMRADLVTLLASGQLDLKGRRLRTASGSDTSGAVFMMVPALGRPAHVGRIWFEPMEK